MTAAVRRAQLADAEAWVETLISGIELAYADLLGPEYGRNRREEQPQHLAAARETLSKPAGHELWLAEDDGAIVAVAETGPGPLEWEVERQHPPPPVTLQLIRMFALPRAYGTGAGQALLDAALGGRAAYLWIFDGNDRAMRFYERNGFRPDGFTAYSGDRWGAKLMYRLYREPITTPAADPPASR